MGGAPEAPEKGTDVDSKDRMTVSEASQYLAVDPETLTRMASERSIPCLEVEGEWVFSRKSIDKWRRQREAKRA